jgi:hypothetical protein
VSVDYRWDAEGNEFFLHFGDGAEIAGDFVTATAGLHPFPKMNVVLMLSGIVEQTLVSAVMSLKIGLRIAIRRSSSLSRPRDTSKFSRLNVARRKETVIKRPSKGSQAEGKK